MSEVSFNPGWVTRVNLNLIQIIILLPLLLRGIGSKLRVASIKSCELVARYGGC
jgi:hypothetical protein